MRQDLNNNFHLKLTGGDNKIVIMMCDEIDTMITIEHGRSLYEITNKIRNNIESANNPEAKRILRTFLNKCLEKYNI